ncbi:MAG: glycosyltransferase family 39 protein [Polyangiaceae bacterium]
MRPLDTPRDHDGLPITTKLEERVSKAIAAVATLFFALVAAWEIGSPPLAGHYASSASMGIIAENMWRWHILGPVWEYTATAPPPSSYYCHHPWGIFWTTALFFKVFGRHDFVCRLAPVLLSSATPPLLYAIGRSVWRPASGAIAALAFVVLPIALSFAAFNALEVPVMTWTLLGLYGWARYLATWRRKYAAIAWVGFLFAVHADWPSYVLVFQMLVFGVARWLVLPRFGFARVPARRYMGLWLALALTSFVSGMAYLLIFAKIGKLNDLVGSYGQRANGNKVPLSAVLASRRYWIELCFTPIAVVLGKVAAIVAAVRFYFVLREEEAIPIFYLGMAVFQYVVFKQGADIHVFWPHTFAAYFALGMGALLATLAPSVARLFSGVRARDLAPIVVLGALAIPLAFVLRDGLPALVYARRTGGRFDEHGRLIDSDGPSIAFLHWLDDRIPSDQKVDLHEGMKPTWAQVWALGGRTVGLNTPLPKSQGPEPVPAPYLVDTRFLLDEAQADLAAKYRVTAVGSFWQVDRTASAPIEAFSFRESEPSFFRWYLVSGTEPERAIVPDPLLTWELRAHFDQPTQPIETEPVTFDDRRILYNMALARGDAARAADLAKDLESELRPLHVMFDDGTELVGARFRDGAQPELLLLLRAGGPAAKDVQLTVKSKVTSPPLLSTTMIDPQEREVGLPLPIAPERWKKGFLYSDHVPIRKRPGREVFVASFWSRRRGAFPKPQDGRKSVEVLALR